MAAAYEAQLRIRREGEERSCAQNDLNSWLSALKNNSCTEAPTKAKITQPKLSAAVSINPNARSVEEERLRGNDFFSQERYHDAIQCYTRCLSKKDASSTKAVVYSNRGTISVILTLALLLKLCVSFHDLSCKQCITFC